MFLVCCIGHGKDLMDIPTTSPQLRNIEHIFIDVPSLVSIPLKLPSSPWGWRMEMKAIVGE